MNTLTIKSVQDYVEKRKEYFYPRKEARSWISEIP